MLHCFVLPFTWWAEEEQVVQRENIKITTVAVLIIATIHTMKISNQAPHAFKRTITPEIINRSSAIILVASFITIMSTVILVETQRTPFMKTLFWSGFCVLYGGRIGWKWRYFKLFRPLQYLWKIDYYHFDADWPYGHFCFLAFYSSEKRTKHIQYPEERVLLWKRMPSSDLENLVSTSQKALQNRYGYHRHRQWPS